MTKYSFPSAFFVTGTDTEVGKTVVCALLTLGLSAGYWKPIRTGLPYTDTDWLRDHAGLPATHFFKETYLFAPHVSPHEAAKAENVQIELNKIKMPDYSPLSHLIVEGAGGLMVPINDNQTILDVILHLQLPVLVVARSGLGTINHTVLTVDKLRQHSIPVLGVIMNGQRHENNRLAIEHYAQVKVLAQIEPMSIVNRQTLLGSFEKYFGKDTNENSTNAFTSLASVHSS